MGGIFVSVMLSSFGLDTEPVIITEVTSGGRYCVLGSASRVLHSYSLHGAESFLRS